MDVITKKRVAKVLVMGVATLLATACQRTVLPFEPVGPVEPVVVEKHHVHHHHHHKCKKHCNGHRKSHHRAYHKARHRNTEMSQSQNANDAANQQTAAVNADAQNFAPAQ